MSANLLSFKHFAALGSSLHYGSQLESACLSHVLDRTYDADREQCWRWLAYGIFYPRSKKFAAENKFRHIEMSLEPFDAVDGEAFAKTMLDPAELVCHGRSMNCAAKDELLICSIKRGTIFYSAPQAGQEIVYVLECEKELEALCEQEAERVLFSRASASGGWRTT